MMEEYTLGYGEGQKFIATTTTTAAKRLPVKRPRKTGSAADSKLIAAVYENIPETESQKNMGSDQERVAEESLSYSAESPLSRAGVLTPQEGTISGSSHRDEPAEAQPQHVRARPNIKRKADRMLRKLAVVENPAVVHGYSVDGHAHEAKASDAETPSVEHFTRDLAPACRLRKRTATSLMSGRTFRKTMSKRRYQKKEDRGQRRTGRRNRGPGLELIKCHRWHFGVSLDCRSVYGSSYTAVVRVGVQLPPHKIELMQIPYVLQHQRGHTWTSG